MNVVGGVAKSGEWGDLAKHHTNGVADSVGEGSLGAGAARKEVVPVRVEGLAACALGVLEARWEEWEAEFTLKEGAKDVGG